MTKKHYEAIARIIASNPFNHMTSGHNSNVFIANTMADYFATDNPRFDRKRFLQACGINN